MASIKYARRGEDHVAYGVRGDGPRSVVFVSNWLMDVESALDAPFIGEAVERTSDYARVVWFDAPGTGHSDPIVGEMPSVETFADIIEVVMDAAGVERAALIGWDLAAAPAVMFAATRPHRVNALVTVGGSARWLADDGYPGIPADELDQGVERLVEMWGTTEYGAFLAPSMAEDQQALEAVARWHRHALSPGMVRRVFSLALRADVRALLGSVTCPALVLASKSAVAGAPLSQSEYMAQHLAHGRLAVFDTSDHLPYQRDHREWIQGISEEFVTGRRPEPRMEDRVLTTVLFTDLVSSTQEAARLGDSEWRAKLDDVEQFAMSEVERYRGRLIKTTGDGILATFEGPARAIRCAAALSEAVQRGAGLSVRAGVHTGEIELRGQDIGGIAVHIAARVMSLAQPDQVLASSTVKDLVVGSGISFTDTGEHDLKGVPGAWRLYAVEV
jgi:class 3 adenylate cyclase